MFMIILVCPTDKLPTHYWQFANCRPTVGQLSADSWPTVSRQYILGTILHYYYFVLDHHVQHLLWLMFLLPVFSIRWESGKSFFKPIVYCSQKKTNDYFSTLKWKPIIFNSVLHEASISQELKKHFLDISVGAQFPSAFYGLDWAWGEWSSTS